eukprot:7013519-Alexandrium_andersonii.AAC.1
MVGAAMRQPACPVRNAAAMTWPGVLRPSVPQRHGRPMYLSSSKCATARGPQPVKAPASSV